MKKWLVALVTLLALMAPSMASAQTQRLAALSQTTCPGSGCVVFPVSFLGSTGVQVAGTFSGTLTVSGSSNGVDYADLKLVPLNGGTATSTMTGVGIWSGSVVGLAWVKVAFTSYSSGTANIALVSAVAKGPGASGTIDGGTCTGSVVTAISSAGDPTCEANPTVTSIATNGGTSSIGSGLNINNNLLFTVDTSYVSAYTIRRNSNALIFSGGTSGYFFNRSDNSVTDLKIDAAGQATFSGTAAATAFIAGTNPSSIGELRLPNAGAGIEFRNATNTADATALRFTSGNLFQAGDNSINYDIQGPSVRFTSVGPHAIGGSTSASQQLVLTGTFAERIGLGIGMTLSSAAADTSRLLDVYGTVNAVAGQNAFATYNRPTFVEAGSGNHSLFATQYIDAATVTAGAASVSNTASLYVAGAMSATVSGKNYALWSAAGENRFGGTVTADGIVSATTYQAGGNAFATATIGPTAPAGTTSTTLVMAGLAGSITTRTGRIMLCMSGVMADSVANDGSKVQMSYGTGSAPIAGAALTGTQVGPIQQFNAANVAAETVPYGACWPVTTLVAGTTYWLDTAFAAITGGTATLTQASMVAHDIP